MRPNILYHDVDTPRYWGENEIDKYLIKNYFERIDRGTYIECGAGNGVNQSNTLILDYGYEWKGILIEPNPHQYEQLKKIRHNVFAANCALVSHDYKEEYIEGFFNGRVKGNVVIAGETSEKEFNDMMSGQIKTNHNYDKKRFPSDEKLASVPTRTLDAVFEESPFDCADFFSLDVEGYEIEVLRGWSPSKYPIAYVLVEGHGTADHLRNKNILLYMEQNNYIFLEKIYNNLLFKKNILSNE